MQTFIKHPKPPTAGWGVLYFLQKFVIFVQCTLQAEGWALLKVVTILCQLGCYFCLIQLVFYLVCSVYIVTLNRGIVCGNDRLSLTLDLGYKLLSVEMTNCLWKWHHCLLKWQTVIKHPIMDRFQISMWINDWFDLLHKVR